MKDRFWKCAGTSESACWRESTRLICLTRFKFYDISTLLSFCLLEEVMKYERLPLRVSAPFEILSPRERRYLSMAFFCDVLEIMLVSSTLPVLLALFGSIRFSLSENEGLVKDWSLS